MIEFAPGAIRERLLYGGAYCCSRVRWLLLVCIFVGLQRHDAFFSFAFGLLLAMRFGVGCSSALLKRLLAMAV